MATFFASILVAVIQGITEMIPVSSSAHLGLCLSFFNLDEYFVELLIHTDHLASAFVLFLFYHKGFLCKEFLYICFKIAIYMLPLVLLVLVIDYCISYRDTLYVWLRTFNIYAFFLVGLGLIICSYTRNNRCQSVSLQNISNISLCIMGCAQILSIISGVSRLGVSIVTARLLGYNYKTATDVSLMLAIPSILCSVVRLVFNPYIREYVSNTLDLYDGLSVVLSFAVTAIVTVMLIRRIVYYMHDKGFVVFGYYRLCVSIVLLVIHIL
ncbi:MAG: bacitracin resistance BacA family protein [Candidatus Xenolissoclinum pacificiensis L6]|uniref:Undecaprenyl-diphosphatase n=1 Tax=Candidatus Xenolissoclinum pacificiensis L6 TaxID=1401685 RepID=W2V0L8_9RICK|nr:MAG: bacitracin resistance BacA family protein [Candidatus Xenolissoclinum pacificiensis L6]